MHAQRRRRARFLFVGYVVLLLCGTHWPSASIPADGRPDLAVHLAAMCVWTLYAAAAQLGGPLLSRRNIAVASGLALIFSVFDEATQAIPIFQREADPADLVADASGIAVAASILFIAGVYRRSAARR